MMWKALAFVPLAMALVACGNPAAVSPGPASGTAAGAGSQASGANPTAGVQLASYRGADRQSVLEAAAKKEGALTWYTTLAGDAIKSLSDGFQAKYPFIKIDVNRGDEAEMATRATQEAQAGRQIFDVIEVAPVTTGLLEQGKILTPFYSSELGRLPDTLKLSAGNGLVDAATVRIAYAGFGWNTTLLPGSVVPKTPRDLLNPELAGKLGLAGSTTGSNWVGSILHQLGDDAGKKLLQDIEAQQKPKVYQVSGQALLDLIAKGEVPAAPTIFLAHVQNAQAKGSPVNWAAVGEAVASIGQDSLAAKAPHPAAGLLFIDYLLSDGADVLRKDGFFPGVDKVDFKIWVPDAGQTPEQAQKNLDSWTQLFKTTFR